MIREILYIFFDFTHDEFLMFLTPTYDTERSPYCSVFRIKNKLPSEALRVL